MNPIVVRLAAPPAAQWCLPADASVPYLAGPFSQPLAAECHGCSSIGRTQLQPITI